MMAKIKIGNSYDKKGIETVTRSIVTIMGQPGDQKTVQMGLKALMHLSKQAHGDAYNTISHIHFDGDTHHHHGAETEAAEDEAAIQVDLDEEDPLA